MALSGDIDMFDSYIEKNLIRPLRKQYHESIYGGYIRDKQRREVKNGFHYGFQICADKHQIHPETFRQATNENVISDVLEQYRHDTKIISVSPIIDNGEELEINYEVEVYLDEKEEIKAMEGYRSYEQLLVDIRSDIIDLSENLQALKYYLENEKFVLDGITDKDVFKQILDLNKWVDSYRKTEVVRTE